LARQVHSSVRGGYHVTVGVVLARAQGRDGLAEGHAAVEGRAARRVVRRSSRLIGLCAGDDVSRRTEVDDVAVTRRLRDSWSPRRDGRVVAVAVGIRTR